MRPVRVVLADDHHLVRAGFRGLIQNLSGFEVVAEAADGREALQQVEKLQPDVVLMDIMMPELDGLGAARQVAAVSPGTRVIMLSMNAGADSVLSAMRAGAAGYLLKDVSPAEFELALRAVARGQTYLCAAASRHVIAGLVHGVGAAPSPLERLTPRQREVLQLIAQGCTTKEIARKLEIGVKTAETHRSQLMQELNIHDIAGLVRFAIRSGLITPDE
ncbi:MAG: response regulator transcription factor [Pirellulaceae bacterium]|nr:response regulator transcription factor [Pirellulaceae bacterium]